jgi:hypothetical protein
MILASIWYPLETVAVSALSDLRGQHFSLMDDTLVSRNPLFRLFCLGMMAQTLVFGVYAAVAEIACLHQGPAFLLRTSLPYNQARILR